MNPEDINILVVDDEPDIQEIIKDLFEIFGFNVDTADSGNKAWSLMQDKEFDVVISDVRMSDGSGSDLLEKIKKKDVNNPKVFFISGYMDYTLEQVLEMGVDGLFAKPFEASVLRESIKRAFQPKKERWSAELSLKTEKTINRNLKSLDDSTKDKTLNFGRGGFFLPLGSDVFKKGELINFNFDFEDEPDCSTIKGKGQIKWVHDNDNNLLPNGVGVEIIYLDQKCINCFVDWLEKQNFRAFIPQR